ncbi:hypothetical protein AKO1_006210 [Acrasis kona]|uniref:PCIF1 WW domain-containing protein n=1 Tax=Acrasis kona TaxID=1008807 RepID=A0AAW2YJ55_9EUKA
MERRTIDKSSNPDPLLPTLTEPYVGPSLFREMSEDVPIKVHMMPKTLEDAINNFETYLKSTEVMCENIQKDKVEDAEKLTQQELQDINDQIKEARDYIYDRSSITIQSVVDKLKSLQKKSGLLLQQKLKTPIERVCTDLAKLCDTYAKDIKKIKENSSPLLVITKREHSVVNIEIQGWDENLTMNASHFNKLIQLYNVWVNRRKSRSRSYYDYTDSHLKNCIARLILRYHTFFGTESYHGVGLQGAITPRTFQYLSRHFDVTMECFASPLNCYYPQFCSAFIDTDRFFGSCGSFFDFYPQSGSFEANPPFTEEIMNKMVDHMEELLGATDLPLSFIIFVPNWTDCSPIIRLSESKYSTKVLILNAKEHRYVTGAQHKELRPHRLEYDSVHETKVAFLQNKAGSDKWKPTDSKIEDMKRVLANESASQWE